MNGATFWSAVTKGIVIAIGVGLVFGVWDMSISLTKLTTRFDVFAQQVADHEDRIRILEARTRP